MKRMLLMLCFVGSVIAAGAQMERATTGDHWVGTWATAQQQPVKSFMPYNNNLSYRSVRQVVKVSIGGKLIRLELSNELSREPLTIRSVYIAHATDSFAIVPQTAKYLLFNGQTQVTIPAGKRVVSDALSFDLLPLEKVAITMNYGRAPAVPTVHMGSRTTSYILKGVSTARSNFAPSFRENHWFNIASIAVFDLTAKAIGIIGNSITDGKGTTDNANNRWTDVLAEQLQKRHGVTTRGILNLGIGNNRVTVAGGFGVLAKQRFNRDILMQPGIETVVIFEGINDIGAAPKGASERVAADLINAYDEMIAKAKARNLRIFLCTITPFKGAGYYSLFHEAARKTVNQWIRSQRERVNGILDFDELLRDPADPERLQKQWQSDWLHPNPEGYRAMGEYAAERLK